jgi:hypothetical protein
MYLKSGHGLIYREKRRGITPVWQKISEKEF